MALTVEELQIVLSCDATTAQAALEKMDATVKAYTDKFKKYFSNLGGTSGGSAKGLSDGISKQLDAVTKSIDKKTRDISKKSKNWKEQFEKTFGMSFEDSMREASKRSNNGNEYVPSGNQYVGSGGRLGPTTSSKSDVFKMTFGKRKANSELLELGGQVRASLEDALGRVNGISDAVRRKIGDSILSVKRLGEEYQKAMTESGSESKQGMAAEGKFKKAIYAADSYIQKLEKIAAKEQEAEAKMGKAKTGAELLKAAGDADTFGASLRKAFDHSILGRFIKQLKRTMLRMAAMKLINGIINGTKQGLQELAKVSTSSSQAMNALSATGGTIKMALGAALMPIIKALTPLLYSLAAAAVTAGNAIANFLAVLTGQGTYTSLQFSKGLDGISKSAGGAGKAVKGMLADFDEINLITSQSGGGGGGGGIESSFANVGEDTKAGSTLAENIRNSIKEGKWDAVGAAVAEQINLSITANLKGATGKKLAQKMSNFFKNTLNLLSGFLEKLDWAGLGATIVNNIVAFFQNVDYAGVAAAIARFLGSAFGAVLAFLGSITASFVESIVSALANAVKWASGFGSVGSLIVDGILAGIVRGLANIAVWAYNNVVVPFINAFSSAFGISGHATAVEESGEQIAAGILVGITNGLEAVVDVFTTLKDKILAGCGIAIEYVKAFFVSLIDYMGVRGELIKARIDQFVNNIKIAILTGLQNVINNLAEGPVGKLLDLIGVDLVGVSNSLGRSIDEAKNKNAQLDEKIGELQTKAKEGINIDANVDHSKVDQYKKTLNSGWSVNVNGTVNVSSLKSQLQKAANVSVRITYNPASGGSVPVGYIRYTAAKGGIFSGPTEVLVGEYAGAKNNPEVIAPLNKLQSILERSGYGGGDSMTREQANTMIGLLRAIEQKELAISPSVGFGQVVQRSLDAYSRA